VLRAESNRTARAAAILIMAQRRCQIVKHVPGTSVGDGHEDEGTHVGQNENCCARSALLVCFAVFSTFNLLLCVKRLVTFDRQRGLIIGGFNRPTQIACASRTPFRAGEQLWRKIPQITVLSAAWRIFVAGRGDLQG